jgi:hypothetical protein
MPKEITHWLVSMKTAEALRGTLMGDSALSNQNALKLGAVFPDILFYLRKTPENSPYRNIAYSWHGTNGEDTYDLIRQIMVAMENSPYRRQLAAFLLGVATHIKTDMAFHPMVYYLTGNYHDAEPSRRNKAIRRHRRLESLVDIYFCGGSRHAKDYNMKAILNNPDIPLPQIMGLLRKDGKWPEIAPGIDVFFEKAFKNMCILQKLYSRRMLGRLLYAVAPVLPESAGEITALFYAPQMDRMIPMLSGTFNYRHPVTGDDKVASLEGLFEEAVRQSSLLSEEIERHLTAGSMSGFSERGTSLSYGIIGAGADQAVYFAENQQETYQQGGIK